MSKIYGWSIFILCIDWKQEKKSERFLKYVPFEILISAKARWIAFAWSATHCSMAMRAEDMSKFAALMVTSPY